MKFYYSWKKTRSRTSVMDRQEKRKNEGGSENGSDDTPDNSDVEDKVSWLLLAPQKKIARLLRMKKKLIFNVKN